MAITQPDRYEAAREILRALEPPFLLRHYDATPDDYEAITDEDLKCEYLDGELIVHSPAPTEHENLTAFLLSLLWEFVTSRGIGRAFGSNAVMQLGVKRLSPDVSVLLTQNRQREQGGRVHGPMDLVVEVISRSTRTYDLQTKLPLYREARVPEIWLVDAERRQFEVHALHGEDYASRVLGTGTGRPFLSRDSSSTSTGSGATPGRAWESVCVPDPASSDPPAGYSASSSAFASRRSPVSNPSVNQA